MRIIGLFVLGNTAFAVGYLLIATAVDTKRVVALGAIGAALGLVLIISDRVTGVKLGGIAEIQAATSRAIAGAEGIEAIQKEVESHRDAITLISRDANSAHEKLRNVDGALTEAKKKSESLEAIQKKAEVKLDQLSSYSEFYELSLAVRSDSRPALDRLIAVAAKPDDARRQLAINLISDLPKEVEHLNLLEYQVDWQKAGFDPSKASLSEFAKTYSANPPIYQTKIMETLWRSEHIPKKERIVFLVEILRTTPSLRCLNFVCRLLNEESKVGKNFLAWQEYETWWKAKGNTY